MHDELEVEVAAEEGLAMAVDADLVRAALLSVLKSEGVAGAQLSVTFVGDATIAALHRDYLHQDGPTDVISFPLPVPGGPVAGDVYVGTEQAARQAAEVGVALAEELLRLAIHGTLHVLGYDHPADDEAREESDMYRRQEALLRAALDAGPPAGPAPAT